MKSIVIIFILIFTNSVFATSLKCQLVEIEDNLSTIRSEAQLGENINLFNTNYACSISSNKDGFFKVVLGHKLTIGDQNENAEDLVETTTETNTSVSVSSIKESVTCKCIISKSGVDI